MVRAEFRHSMVTIGSHLTTDGHSGGKDLAPDGKRVAEPMPVKTPESPESVATAFLVLSAPGNCSPLSRAGSLSITAVSVPGHAPKATASGFLT